MKEDGSRRVHGSGASLFITASILSRHLPSSFYIQGALGIHWRTRALGPQIMAIAKGSWANVSSVALWNDWSASLFGEGVGFEAASILASVDSFDLPRPVNWINGPGGLAPSLSEMFV